jgi:hypothetical protein
MKNVVEKLEKADVELLGMDNFDSYNEHQIEKALEHIRSVIAELETPRWYTPERWDAETGEPWPDNAAVYLRGFDKKECGCAFGHAEQFYHEWVITTYENAKWVVSRDYFLNVIIICATEAGCPPDGWKPEE